MFTNFGKGTGNTLNPPFEIGVSSEKYKSLLNLVIKSILKFNPSYLMLSAGFDTHKREYQTLPPLTNLDNPDYFELERMIGGVNIPTCVILEEGYNTEVLGRAFVELTKGPGAR